MYLIYRIEKNIVKRSSLIIFPIKGPEVDDWAALTEELSWPLQEYSQKANTRGSPPMTCRDLIGHMSLVHRTTRRRWATTRLEARLARNQDTLLSDYKARVRILEELGFLDKTTPLGCLTRKGAWIFICSGTPMNL